MNIRYLPTHEIRERAENPKTYPEVVRLCLEELQNRRPTHIDLKTKH